MCSWNIAGLRDKLHDPNFLNFILQYDIVWILEVKKCFNVSVPGFRVHYNPSKWGRHRGGITMLIRDRLFEFVKSIDMKTEGQIWITLNFLVSYKLGGVYIPPEDSPYCQPSDMGVLAAQTSETGNIMALGDFNARVAVPNLTDTQNNLYKYSGVVDNTLNVCGRCL